ncbi:MAG: hypothetical protein AAB116_25645 [Candidatus Poribacteria bacterium]
MSCFRATTRLRVILGGVVLFFCLVNLVPRVVLAASSAIVTVNVTIVSPPKITAVTPADGSFFDEGDTITISCTVNYASSSIEYQFSIEDNIKQPWSINSSYKWVTASRDAGLHKLKIEVRNIAGQDTKETEIYVYLKPVPPT